MARWNRLSLPFIGLLISSTPAFFAGCGFDTSGIPPNSVSTGSTGTSGGNGGTGGEGGMAGTGGVGAGKACVPDATMSCYSGDVKTINVGTCVPGKQICKADGSGYGDCMGEVLPTMENCVVAGDEDCDGFADIDDPECKCTTPMAPMPCNTGLPATCAMGMGTCSADGRDILDCKPVIQENCATPEDDNCDGIVAPMCTGDLKLTYTAGPGTGMTKDDSIFSVAATPDGGYVIVGMVEGTLVAADSYGVTAGKAYVAKLKPDLTLDWEKKYTAGTFAVARGVSIDKDGNIIVVGSFNGNIMLEGMSGTSNTPDGFIVKYDKNGLPLWKRLIITAKTQDVSAVTVDAAGNIFITGSSDGAVDFGGGARTPGGTDFFMVKYSPDNMHIWSKMIGGTGNQYGRALATTPNDDVVVIGDVDNNTVDLGNGMVWPKGMNFDFFVARYASATGAYVWGQNYGKAADQTGHGIATTASGDVLITGTFAGTVDWKMGTSMTAVGASDVFIAKLDGSTGNYMLHKQAGTMGSTVTGIAVGEDASGNVTLAGHFDGSFDFGNGAMASTTGTVDAFLVKFKIGDWSPVWSKRIGDTGDQFGWDVALGSNGSALIGGGFTTALVVPPNTTPSTGASDIYAVTIDP